MSTPAIAAILFGAAIVVSQAQSQDPAKGATLDPAQFILGIHANPVGSDGLVASDTSTSILYRGGTATSSPLHDESRGGAGSRYSNKDATAAFLRKLRTTGQNNCDPCPGTIVDLLMQALAAIDLDREEVFDVRHERRKNRRIRHSIHKHRQARRVHRREARLEWQDSHQTTPSTDSPNHQAGDTPGEDSSPDEDTRPTPTPTPPSDDGAGKGSGDGYPDPPPPPPPPPPRSDTPAPTSPPHHPEPRQHHPSPPKSVPRPNTAGVDGELSLPSRYSG